ncbi:unnamed protein product [Vicia faba]|uniref:Uncharacterized protein n=1 Tax=Vicia faba TaxID=3906 RepID=A0AAV0YQE3_VICFA|nr:unnamed protein product [Vicia faba]
MKMLQLVVLTLLLSVSYFNFEAYGDELENTKCDPPCQQYSPPPPPPPSDGYPIYTAPPPPPPHHEKEKCPPAGSGVVCCTPPAPYTYGPPSPYAPPNPYTYVPYDEGEHSSSGYNVVMRFLVSILILFSSFIVF